MQRKQTERDAFQPATAIHEAAQSRQSYNTTTGTKGAGCLRWQERLGVPVYGEESYSDLYISNPNRDSEAIPPPVAANKRPVSAT